MQNGGPFEYTKRSWSPEKLVVAQSARKLLAVRGTRKFIKAFRNLVDTDVSEEIRSSIIRIAAFGLTAVKTPNLIKRDLVLFQVRCYGSD